jgi:hypothetical protein
MSDFGRRISWQRRLFSLRPRYLSCLVPNSVSRPLCRKSEALIVIWHLVKVRPGKNYLPQALRVLIVAARNGFNLDHAKQGWQQQSRGVSVGWDDNFVEELKTGLHACRVMCVSTLITLSPRTRSH